jgi:predicted Zn-dependent protease
MRAGLIPHFHGNEAWELFEEESRSVSARANPQQPLQTLESVASGVGVRLAADGRGGFAASNGSQPGQAVVELARESARYGVPAQFEFARPQCYPAVANCDPELESLTVSQLSDWLLDGLSRTALKSVPGAEVSAQRQVLTRGITNHYGVDVSHRSAVLVLVVSAPRGEGFDLLRERQTSCRLDVSIEQAAERFLERYRAVAGGLAPRAAASQSPTIFSPRAVATLLEILERHLVTVTTMPDQQEFLPLLQDQLLMHNNVTVCDQAARSWLPGAAPFDDEGVARQNRTIVDRGRLVSFITDLRSASAGSQLPTGNAVRAGFDSPPAPAFHNAALLPGDTDLADMLASVKQGLWIEEIRGFHPEGRAFGDFAAEIGFGYVVENSKRAGLVRSALVRGNVCSLLGDDLVAIGSAPDTVGQLPAPPILTRGIHVL